MEKYMELSSLCKELGYSAKNLYSISNEIEKHYIKVQIPKKSGGYRELRVPDKRLKSIQNRINRRLLCLEPVSQYATAYVKGRGISKNAEPHVGQAKILKLDVKGFFDSVIFSQVKSKAFPEGKYTDTVRILLTILCTYDQHLPQGAPTSPAISNIIMNDFDERIGSWCEKKGIKYTRYCDDMTFSGNFDEKEIINFVREQLRREGFFINKKKTICIRNNQRQSVTGIIVNEILNVESEYKKRIRQEMYYINKYGIEEHISRVHKDEVQEQVLHRLLGQVNYVLSICESDEFCGYHQQLQALLKGDIRINE